MLLVLAILLSFTACDEGTEKGSGEKGNVSGVKAMKTESYLTEAMETA